MKRIMELLFNSGIVIALFTLVGYISCFIYQSGILDYYKLPFTFIDYSISSIFETNVTFIFKLFFISILLASIIYGVISGFKEGYFTKYLYEKFSGSKFSDLINNAVPIIFIFCVCAILISLNIDGYKSAQNETEYFVAEDYNNNIVVYLSAERFFLMPLEDNVLQNEYQIVSTEKIGKLKKVKLENVQMYEAY